MRDLIKNPPKIFMVNWFRKGAAGNFLWPGYGENLRVLKWMLDRIHDRIPARMTAVGSVPDVTDLDLTGLEIAPDDLREALAVKPEEWKIETQSASRVLRQDRRNGSAGTPPPPVRDERCAERRRLPR